MLLSLSRARHRSFWLYSVPNVLRNCGVNGVLGDVGRVIPDACLHVRMNIFDRETLSR